MLAVGILWDKLVKTENQLTSRKKVSLPFNPNKTISFQDDFIVVNTDGQTKVFSSHCTHLGCTINKMEGDKLVCPCHGSAFDMDGNATKGPAVRSLAEKKFKLNTSTQQIEIEV